MGKIKGINREELKELNVLERIKDKNEIYVIDEFVERLVKSEPEIYEWKENKGKGRNSYEGKIFLKMFIYCYLNGISGSRSMVKENERNIELIWLTEDVKPEYRTIIDYRREKKEAIKKMVVEFRLFLKKFEYVTGEEVVYDGSKIKGDAGKQIYSIEKIDKKLKNIKEDNEKYMKEWEKIDELEDDLESKTNQINELTKKIEELNKKTEKYEDLKKKYRL